MADKLGISYHDKLFFWPQQNNSKLILNEKGVFFQKIQTYARSTEKQRLPDPLWAVFKLKYCRLKLKLKYCRVNGNLNIITMYMYGWYGDPPPWHMICTAPIRIMALSLPCPIKGWILQPAPSPIHIHYKYTNNTENYKYKYKYNKNTRYKQYHD